MFLLPPGTVAGISLQYILLFTFLFPFFFFNKRFSLGTGKLNTGNLDRYPLDRLKIENMSISNRHQKATAYLCDTCVHLKKNKL